MAVGAAPPGGSEISADVAQLLQISAQPATLTVTVDQGGSSSPQTIRVDVLSNLAAGYAVTVRRTVLTRGDLTVTLAGVAPANPQLVLDWPTAPTVLPPGSQRAFGHRSGISDGRDRWQARVAVGPIACPETGLHTGTLTFTTRAGSLTEVASIALVVNVRRNRRLCG